ncbi:MAG: sterol desaturase family protein [Pseudomonadota bacterium]
MSTSTNPFIIFIDMGLGSFLFDFSRYIIAAGLISAIVWLLMRTSMRTRKIQKRNATFAEVRRELLQSIRSCFVYIGIGVALVWAINMGYLERVGESFGWPTDLALLAVMIVVHDAYFYWAHRAMHLPFLYKRFHLAHHRSVTPTPFAAYSFSVGEAVVMGLFVTIWQFFVPTPGLVLFTFLAFQIIRNAMGHAGFELHPRWWLSSPLTRWITTTTHHDLHHSGGFGRNFGLYFTYWDRLMGTEHPDYAATFHRVTAPAEIATVKPNVEGAAG